VLSPLDTGLVSLFPVFPLSARVLPLSISRSLIIEVVTCLAPPEFYHFLLTDFYLSLSNTSFTLLREFSTVCLRVGKRSSSSKVIPLLHSPRIPPGHIRPSCCGVLLAHPFFTGRRGQDCTFEIRRTQPLLPLFTVGQVVLRPLRRFLSRIARVPCNPSGRPSLQFFSIPTNFSS